MKKLLIGLIALTALISSASAVDGQQRELAKKELVKVYNAFSKMDNTEYQKSLNLLAKNAKEAGLASEAELFSSLAIDPASRLEVLDQMKNKIEEASENGIYFVVYLMYPQTWCFAGDLRCGFGVGLLSILTLSGDEASNL